MNSGQLGLGTFHWNKAERLVNWQQVNFTMITAAVQVERQRNVLFISTMTVFMVCFLRTKCFL